MTTGGIPFTQYLRPYGTRRLEYFDAATPETTRMAKEILASGRYRFEIEVLSDNLTVSATIFDLFKQEDLDCELCPNTPTTVAPAINRLISRFHTRLKNGDFPE